jgi:hypothetical protein
MTLPRGAPLGASPDQVHRLLRWAVVTAVALFAASWTVVGALTPRYDEVQEPISRLAQRHAPYRLVMVGALLVIGVLLPVWGWVLAHALDLPELRVIATTSGIGIIGLALVPLNEDEAVHSLFGLAVYVSSSLVPLLGCRAVRSVRIRHASRLLGVLTALAFALSVQGVCTGLFQRLGLTAVQVWFVALGHHGLRVAAVAAA